MALQGWSALPVADGLTSYLRSLAAGLDVGGAAVMGSVTLAFGLAVSLGAVGALFTSFEGRR